MLNSYHALYNKSINQFLHAWQLINQSIKFCMHGNQSINQILHAWQSINRVYMHGNQSIFACIVEGRTTTAQGTVDMSVEVYRCKLNQIYNKMCIACPNLIQTTARKTVAAFLSLNIIMQLFETDTLSSHAISKNVCKSDFLPSPFHTMHDAWVRI